MDVQFFQNGDQYMLTNKKFAIRWRFNSNVNYELELAEIVHFDDFQRFCCQVVLPPDFVVYAGNLSDWKPVFHRFIYLTTLQFNGVSL